MEDTKDIKENGDAVIKQMFEAGMHYGYSKTRRHPSVASYIYTTKNKVDIINLEQTKLMVEKAMAFVKELGTKNKIILLVGAKPETKEVIKNLAETLGMPYVNERWIGGTLTNFSEIKKRIFELETYRKENAGGELNKYTKKERVVLAKKMEKMERYYSGLISLKKAPDALLIIDPKAELISVTEANKMKLPLVVLANSDSNIKNITYPVVGNDASIPSIKLFADFVLKAYQDGKMIIPTTPTNVEGVSTETKTASV
jgi:small subunit ribosomal protein S2